MAFAAAIGVSVDDMLYFLIFHARHGNRTAEHAALRLSVQTAGVAVLQTTVVIVVSLTVLFASTFSVLSEVCVALIASLTVPTAVTLFIAPTALGVRRTKFGR